MHGFHIFYANNRLVISLVGPEIERKGSDFYVFDKIESWESILNLMFSAEHPKIIWVNTSDDELTFADFSRHLQPIEAAGGVIFNELNELLVIERRGFYDLPKGKMDPGESPKQTAVREVIEECGIANVQITGFLTRTYHLYQLGENRVLKTTHWFRMKTHKQPLVPQTSEDITDAFWLPLAEIDRFIQRTHPTLRFLVENM